MVEEEKKFERDVISFSIMHELPQEVFLFANFSLYNFKSNKNNSLPPKLVGNLPYPHVGVRMLFLSPLYCRAVNPLIQTRQM